MRTYSACSADGQSQHPMRSKPWSYNGLYGSCSMRMYSQTSSARQSRMGYTLVCPGTKGLCSTALMPPRWNDSYRRLPSMVIVSPAERKLVMGPSLQTLQHQRKSLAGGPKEGKVLVERSTRPLDLQPDPAVAGELLHVCHCFRELEPGIHKEGCQLLHCLTRDPHNDKAVLAAAERDGDRQVPALAGDAPDGVDGVFLHVAEPCLVRGRGIVKRADPFVQPSRAAADLPDLERVLTGIRQAVAVRPGHAEAVERLARLDEHHVAGHVYPACSR